MAAALKGLLFDVYGTLFDVHSVIQKCEALYPNQGKALSQLWRGKQLEYTWLRSLMGRYQPFHEVTAAALRYACRALGLRLDDAQRAELMQAYLYLTPYPDVEPALERMQGLPLGVFSNGSPQMLEPLLRHSALDKYFSHTISVDDVKIFKPSAAVYTLGQQRLGAGKAGELALVSSNCWDVCGALSFGMQAFWVNRAGQPLDELGYSPTHTVKNLLELADQLGIA